MDPSCRGQLFHSQRLLHVLGKLCFPNRSYVIHPPRARSPRRLRPHLVGDVSRELGGDGLEPMAMDHNRFNCRNVCRRYYPHRCPLRFLRWIWMHSQPILHHLQLNPLHHHHDHVYSPHRSRVQPTIRSRPGQHGRRLLYISDCVRCREPRDRYMQEPY